MCLLLISIGFIHAQKYNFSTFDLENEYNISTIQNLGIGSNGYLYLAGGEAVYYFDGKSVEKVLSDFSLPFSEFSGLQEVDEHGLALIANGRLYIYGEQSAVIEEETHSFLKFDENWLIGTNNGLVFYHATRNIIDRPEALEILTTFQINDLALAGQNLYIATNNGLYKYDLESKLLENFSTIPDANLRKIVLDGRRNLWTYDNTGKIFQVHLPSKSVRTFENQGYQFSSIAVDSLDRIWFGSSNKGILLHDGLSSKWMIMDQSSGLSDNRVMDIACDKWGEIWIATADVILSKFINKDYALYNVYDGLPSDEVTAISADPNLLVAAGNQGIFELNDNKFTPRYLLDIKCEAIYQDTASVWVGTNGSGLIKFENNESTVFSKNAGLPSDWVNKIVKSGDGTIWIATPSNGVASLEQRDSAIISISTFGKEEGIKDPYITALLAHSSGAIYYGTREGKIGMINYGRHTALNLADSISSEITSIIEGEFGDLYFSTLGDGIYNYGSGKKAPIKKLPELPERVKALALKDDMLYAANEKGVFSEKASFTTMDGFPSGKVIKSGMAVYEGRTWIATGDGLISLGPLKRQSKKKVPILFFENIQANYNPIPIDRSAIPEGGTTINYNENQISFEFQGVNIHSKRDIQYSYLLQGHDKNWSPWTKNDNPSFNNLSAGNYTFLVKARSDEDSISEPISYSFTINGPFWREWWFIPAVITMISFLFFLLFRSRIRKIRKKNEEEKAQLELKNKLLELEQKSNQLQMNPHFIFNALNSIQATVAKEDYRDARKEISDFATLMRSILANSKERTISLEDELRLLNKYIDIEKKCRNLTFIKQVNIDPAIDPEECMIPPMLIQPFVENAIVHGLRNQKNGQLTLDFSLVTEGVLSVKIIDNGVGYDNNRKQETRKKHKSVAINVTKERLEALLDEKYYPVVTIEQISEKGGTAVKIKIPVEYDF